MKKEEPEQNIKWIFKDLNNIYNPDEDDCNNGGVYVPKPFPVECLHKIIKVDEKWKFEDEKLQGVCLLMFECIQCGTEDYMDCHCLDLKQPCCHEIPTDYLCNKCKEAEDLDAGLF